MRMHIKPFAMLGAIACLASLAPTQETDAFGSQLWRCVYKGTHYATLENSTNCPGAHGDKNLASDVIWYEQVQYSEKLATGDEELHDQGDPVNCFGEPELLGGSKP